jgi:hypothetical protein
MLVQVRTGYASLGQVMSGYALLGHIRTQVRSGYIWSGQVKPFCFKLCQVSASHFTLGHFMKICVI